MKHIEHHIPDALLAAYVAGSIGTPFAVVLASHISMCNECRARHGAHLATGGAVMDSLDGMQVSSELLDRVLDAIDQPAPSESLPRGFDIFPEPIAQFLGHEQPNWQRIGRGAKQAILMSGDEGTMRLLYIPAGQTVPEHTHNGLELTLVLQGSFTDEDGTFAAGDIEIADEETDHAPVAGDEVDCICIAATDAPLKFSGMMPRILQPILRI